MNNQKSLKESLEIIEGLTYLWENSPQTLKNAKRIIENIYSVAHLHNNNCKAHHVDWRYKRAKLLKELKRDKII